MVWPQAFVEEKCVLFTVIAVNALIITPISFKVTPFFTCQVHQKCKQLMCKVGDIWLSFTQLQAVTGICK